MIGERLRFKQRQRPDPDRINHCRAGVECGSGFVETRPSESGRRSYYSPGRGIEIRQLRPNRRIAKLRGPGRERVSIPEVPTLSQHGPTSCNHDESAWRTVNTGFRLGSRSETLATCLLTDDCSPPQPSTTRG